MADLMTFPNTWEEYERFYGFTDTEEIYTNGARLIPSFRVEQWLEHIAHIAQSEVAKDTNVPSTDCISRQQAIEGADKIIERDTSGNNDVVKAMQAWKEWIMGLPSAQPEQTDCDYCHENFDGYVRPIEKNSHAFIYFGMNGWELNLRAKGWRGSAKIMYCPMCGRRLERG